MQNAFLIGKTVYLRPVERHDAPLIQPWFNDPDVTRTLRTIGPVSLRAEETFIDKVVANEHMVAAVIVRRDVDQPVGVTGLTDIDFRNRHAVFGITIGAKDSWDCGFGTEATFLMVAHAFETLNLNRVMLQVHASNPRGQRAYEKVGFRLEGVLRQENFREGRYWDTVVMAILRQEWDETREKLAPVCLPSKLPS
jgi:RimJ/RimL family protein N-acetyltransferase